jgi:hypothetical protein
VVCLVTDHPPARRSQRVSTGTVDKRSARSDVGVWTFRPFGVCSFGPVGVYVLARICDWRTTPITCSLLSIRVDFVVGRSADGTSCLSLSTRYIRVTVNDPRRNGCCISARRAGCTLVSRIWCTSAEVRLDVAHPNRSRSGRS